MVSALDLSLDEIVAASQARGRREGPYRGPRRIIQKRDDARQDRAMHPQRTGARQRGGDGPSHRVVFHQAPGPRGRPPVRNNAPLVIEKFVVRVSGLDYSVLQSDLKELFTSVGTPQRVWIDYDRTDRSKGTGGCVFTSREEARRAVQSFDGKIIEGSPISVELQADSYFHQRRRGGRFDNSFNSRRGGRTGNDHEGRFREPRDIAPW